MDIGRNDACHCGSGKKYKKCCMNKVTSIEAIRHADLEKMQGELMQFASSVYSREMDKAVREKMRKFNIGEDQQIYGSLLVWAVFSVNVGNGTILEAFIEKKRHENVRPVTMAQLEKWAGAVPTFSVIEHVTDDESYTVKDLFTEEVKDVRVDEGTHSFKSGAMLLGYLLPFGDYYTYFMMQLEFEEAQTEFNKKLTLKLFEESTFDDIGAFMADQFPEMLISMLTEPVEEEPQVEEKPLVEEELAWDEPLYENAALKMQRNLLQAHVPVETAEKAFALMHKYLHSVKPTIKKEVIYSAGMHYFVEKHMYKQGMTQKKIAELYEVSTSSLSKVYKEMKAELEADLTEDSITVSEIGDAKKYSDADRARAQELIFEAMESSPQQRLKLATQAMEIYPYHPDAYNMLGEAESDPAKQLELYKRGMEAGEADLGKEIFKEDKGMFWGMVETRPYMRSKFNYAILEAAMGNLTEAIKQCEELLELNEMDSQGVRYTLFVMYMDAGEHKKAKALLEKFEETDFAAGAYNMLLVEFALKGMTPAVERLAQKAKNVNPVIYDVLAGKRKLPKEPEEFGQEYEAVEYFMEYGFVWSNHPELVEWMSE
ncbi:SEC-C metal-binding domain-containing protein [Metabacillus sp. cB07]|uniref:SEC-C metal-binding domain-containing protein n=1 Tax=Metabacillus sp. cB07 TaxID=2806989 RepID=UPI001939A85D|nr:SEC-C metal-binding domain-containing protein [Metabacillus sp. cB07]